MIDWETKETTQYNKGKIKEESKKSNSTGLRKSQKQSDFISVVFISLKNQRKNSRDQKKNKENKNKSEFCMLWQEFPIPKTKAHKSLKSLHIVLHF